MKKAANRKRPAVNKVYYIYVGILAVLFFIFHTIPFLKQCDEKYDVANVD